MGRTWVLVALGACAVLVAVSRTAGRIELVDRHSGIAPLHPQRAGGAFTNDWDGWLRKVTLQVRAAVDLSKGLSAAKKERLDGILAHDVVKDEKEGEEVAAQLRKRYGGSQSSASAAQGSASARRKAAVQAVQLHSAAHSLSKAAKAREAHSEDLERAAPKVNEAQIKAEVRVEGRSGIDPYGKRLGNKVAEDDAAVRADEMRVKMAEKQLKAEETPTIGSDHRGAAASSAPPKPARGRMVHARASAAVQASVKPTAVSASGLGSQEKDMEDNSLQEVLQTTLHGDKKKAAKEEKAEERQFARELHKLGLAPAVGRKKKTGMKWPSQLELPGQQRSKKAPYQDD